MTSTQKNLVTAIDGTQLVIVTPKFTATTMTYVDYKIALALGQLLEFETKATFAELDAIQANLNKVFSAHNNKNDWKNGFTATFSFSQAFEAETLATAIHWFHAAKPIVSVDYTTKTITVSSHGYAA
jgi:hypothetical protein